MAMDLEDEAYMFLRALDRMDHRVTSCLMKRGEDLCHIKEDGKFNYIPMALVRRIRRKMMTILAMLKQENQQLQIQQAELMDTRGRAWKPRCMTFNVSWSSRPSERQSDESVKRQLEMTVDEPPKETDLEVERCRLYELTPMQQFEQLQSLMGTVTPTPAKRGGRGQGQRERSKSGATLKKLNQAWEKGGPGLRAAKIARVQPGREGLLDSGATHALRPKLRGEDLQRYRQVRVTLAAGGAQDIRMTEGETLVHNSENVEPIVPAGRLVRDLGCRIEWGEACTLEHPVKGNIDLRVEAGCPQMDHDIALDLIRELEESRSRTTLRCYRFGETHNDVDWLDRVVADCPIFDKAPIRIKD